MSSSTIGDIRDPAALKGAIARIAPEIIFHLAAQPLVRDSYEQPTETFHINVMGVVHLLEAVRSVPGVRALVNVTTDKCYDNKERLRGYREDEPLGGRDPYSSSKACAELVTAAYRESFLGASGVGVATARAGNVIGGGDWAKDRLVPDIFRSIDRHATLTIRSPEATRPWQHVLEPVSGYLLLAERLWADDHSFAQAWNFGPTDNDTQTVRWILEHFVSRYPGISWKPDAAANPHEAHYLRLDSSKARAQLGWRPRWPLAKALDRACEWYDGWTHGEDMHALTTRQIAEYSRIDA
jgi:CDP-glucose 4,6-dehydratase